MSRATIYDNDETREDEVDPIEVIRAHTPSITNEIEEWAIEGDPEAFDEDGDYVGQARRCRCGLFIEGYYSYVDHLIAMFGGESHIGG